MEQSFRLLSIDRRLSASTHSPSILEPAPQRRGMPGEDNVRSVDMAPSTTAKWKLIRSGFVVFVLFQEVRFYRVLGRFGGRFLRIWGRRGTIVGD